VGLQVGKSLLIKSLIKHYTKHNMPEVRGPITIVSGLYFFLYPKSYGEVNIKKKKEN